MTTFDHHPRRLVIRGILFLALLGSATAASAREFLLARCQMDRNDHCSLNITPTRFWLEGGFTAKVTDLQGKPLQEVRLSVVPLSQRGGTLGEGLIRLRLEQMKERGDIQFGPAREVDTTDLGQATFSSVSAGDYSLQIDWSQVRQEIIQLEISFKTGEQAKPFLPVARP